jgi:tetratricopeptide (TPR) repeat protein
MLNFGHGVPETAVDLRAVGDWCPRCFVDGQPAAPVSQLGIYLELLTLAYGAASSEVAQARRLWEDEGRTILGSEYLGAIVPETAATYEVLGIDEARAGNLTEAVVHFRRAVALNPGNAAAHWHLGAALAQQGDLDEALKHISRSVDLDPNNPDAVNDLRVLQQRGR